MTQTPPNKSTPSLGAAAAAAATTSTSTGGSAAASPKPGDKPSVEGDKPPNGTPTVTPGKKREAKRKVFVVVGTVSEFESIVQAEKYLNSPEAPTGDYVVLHGVRTRKNTKVSLR